jgi:hypothetical protein
MDCTFSATKLPGEEPLLLTTFFLAEASLIRYSRVWAARIIQVKGVSQPFVVMPPASTRVEMMGPLSLLFSDKFEGSLTEGDRDCSEFYRLKQEKAGYISQLER